MPTVADLLALSRAAHLEYRRHLPRMGSLRGQLQTLAGDPVAARVALDQAATARKDADDADPDHLDPAWASDEATIGNHDHLRTFYAEVLAQPSPTEELKAKATNRVDAKPPVDSPRTNGKP